MPSKLPPIPTHSQPLVANAQGTPDPRWYEWLAQFSGYVRGLPTSSGGGVGDMLKSVYDTDDDGTVDHAALADAAPWDGITDKPAFGTAALADTGDFDAAGAAAAAQAASQPLDSDLTAIAALSTTSFGRALLELANAAALRTAAGLVIGTDVQAYDAELAALAGLTSAADRLPYFTGSGTASLATFTSAGRALVDDADASAQRTTLGLTIGTDVQAYDADLAALAANSINGLWARTGSGTGAARTLTGTSNRLTVTNGDGGSGNPTFDISASYVGQTSITTLGTITTGTWTGTAIAVANGGTGATSASNARTNLGLAIGSDVQAYSATLAAVAGGTYTGATSITTLGTIATGTWNGTTIAVANGGTGATSASGARTNLGLAIGSDVQAYNANLTTWAGKTAPSGTVLGTSDTQPVTNKDLTSSTNTFPLAAATPLVMASTGAVGTAVKFAREDHVHPAPAFVTTTPTPTSTTGSGSFTSASCSLSTLVAGKAVTICGDVTVTTVGGATGAIVVPLTVTPAKNAAILVFQATDGNAAIGFVNSGDAHLYIYAPGFASPIVGGKTWYFGGSFPST